MILVTYAMPEEEPRLAWTPELVPVQTGIGKVLSVSRVARIIAQERVEKIISVGFCGGLNGTPQGAIVQADRVRQWDLSLGDLKIPLGHGYAMHAPLAIPEFCLTSVPNPVRGTLISGDRFVDASVHVDPDAVAVDMETAALAVLACEFGIPFFSVREASDVADGPQEATHLQFMEWIRERGPGYSDAVAELADLAPGVVRAPKKIARAS